MAEADTTDAKCWYIVWDDGETPDGESSPYEASEPATDEPPEDEEDYTSAEGTDEETGQA